MTMGHTVFELLNLPFLGGSIAIMRDGQPGVLSYL
jgi:hypothetical protein